MWYETLVNSIWRSLGHPYDFNLFVARRLYDFVYDNEHDPMDYTASQRAVENLRTV